MASALSVGSMRGGLATIGLDRANTGRRSKITSGPAQRNRSRSLSPARQASTSGSRSWSRIRLCTVALWRPPNPSRSRKRAKVKEPPIASALARNVANPRAIATQNSNVCFTLASAARACSTQAFSSLVSDGRPEML